MAQEVQILVQAPRRRFAAHSLLHSCPSSRSWQRTPSVERVLGIGGGFFRASDPDGLRRWYGEHLGINVQEGAAHPSKAA